MAKSPGKVWDFLKTTYIGEVYGVDRCIKEARKHGFKKVPNRQTVYKRVRSEGWHESRIKLLQDLGEELMDELKKAKIDNFRIRQAAKAKFVQDLKAGRITISFNEVLAAIKCDMADMGELQPETQINITKEISVKNILLQYSAAKRDLKKELPKLEVQNG